MLRSTLPSAILFIIGYAMAACALITVRNLIGYVGNGTDIVLILGVGLLGSFLLGLNAGGRSTLATRSTRRRVIRNLTATLLLLGLSLSVIVLDAFFLSFAEIGFMNRLLLTFLFTFIFLLPSAFLLGHSVPLLAGYFRQLSSGRAAGRVLVALGLGALSGVCLTLLILMPFSGVHIAALSVIILLTLAIALLNRALTFRTMLVPGLVMLGCIALNSHYIFRALGIYHQNAYNSVRIITTEDGTRALLANNLVTATYNPETKETALVTTAAEDILLKPLGTEVSHDILVIGAGGFTFGLQDTLNAITYVDFDPDIKGVIEDHFLGQKLTPNKKFVAGSARSALLDAIRTGKKYDVVYVNAYNGEIWLPESLVTQDFFEDIRQVLKPEGVAGANLIVSPSLENDYSLYLDNTFRSVFPVQMRMPAYPVNVRERNKAYMMPFLYVGYNAPLSKSGTIYTDERSRVMFSKPLNRSY
jgi:spermidine synthase